MRCLSLNLCVVHRFPVIGTADETVARRRVAFARSGTARFAVVGLVDGWCQPLVVAGSVLLEQRDQLPHLGIVRAVWSPACFADHGIECAEVFGCDGQPRFVPRQVGDLQRIGADDEVATS